MDPDSLVATRARRANAGSRLKQLIEIEELASGIRNTVYTEEDEDVQLLFQEDENDVEFEDPDEVEEDEDDDEEEEDQDEDEAQQAETGGAEQPVGHAMESESDVERAVNSDEMLSDSDLSASDLDESEGERELEKAEKDKKRKKKQGTIIPEIKRPKPTSQPKPKPVVNHSETLLTTHRRASSRKSAVQNKEALLQRLKEDETRRAALDPIVRVKEREPTQEERLAQAVETERENILSLHNFLEQEIVKKERQRLMLQQRRMKLRNVIRLTSAETFVTPLEEIEDARNVQDMFERKRRGRKRKNFRDETDSTRPGAIDTQLPYYRREMEERWRREAIERRLAEERAEKRRIQEAAREKKRQELEAERLARKEHKEARFKEFENVDVTQTRPDGSSSHECASADDATPVDKKSDTVNVSEEAKSEVDEPGINETNEAREGDLNGNEEVAGGEIAVKSEEQELPATEVQGEPLEEVEKVSGKTNSNGTEEEASADQETVEEETGEEEPKIKDQNDEQTEDLKEEAASDIKTDKKVSFADEKSIEEDDTKDVLQEEAQDEEVHEEELSRSATPVYKPAADGTMFEGPVQHVSRNLVYLLDFDEQDRWGLTDVKIKSIMFGEDAALPNRRLREVKTIFKSSTRLDNPYAPPKEEKEDELLIPVTDITEEDAMFEVLNRLPHLGDKDIMEEEIEDDFKETASEIQIRTEAPSGLYLPNGNKKLCLISGKEVRYFDPVTGLPYESKEVYLVIKSLTEGAYAWYSMGKDQNTYGAVEMFLDNREGSRHAEGVPEGFDGP